MIEFFSLCQILFDPLNKGGYREGNSFYFAGVVQTHLTKRVLRAVIELLIQLETEMV